MGCRELQITDYFRLTPSTGTPNTSIYNSPDTSKKPPRGFKPVVSVLVSNYRYYSPQVGKWLSRDPLGEYAGKNIYHFVLNSPISSWDYLGLRDFGTIYDNIQRDTNEWFNEELEDMWKPFADLDAVAKKYMRKVECMVLIIQGHTSWAENFLDHLEYGEDARVAPFSCFDEDMKDSIPPGNQVDGWEYSKTFRGVKDIPRRQIPAVNKDPDPDYNAGYGYGPINFQKSFNINYKKAEKLAAKMAEDCHCKCKEILLVLRRQTQKENLYGERLVTPKGTSTKVFPCAKRPCEKGNGQCKSCESN